MTERKPIDFEAYRFRKGIENRLIPTFGIVRSLSDVQIPLDSDRGGRLAWQGIITLGEALAIIEGPEKHDGMHYIGMKKLEDYHQDLLAQLQAVGAALLDRRHPEALPILLAGGAFWDDDVQEKIHENNRFYQDESWWNLLTRSFEFQDNGGAIIFPSFDDFIPAVLAINNRKGPIYFRNYRGTYLSKNVKSQQTDVNLALEMIRPFRISLDK